MRNRPPLATDRDPLDIMKVTVSCILDAAKISRQRIESRMQMQSEAIGALMVSQLVQGVVIILLVIDRL